MCCVAALSVGREFVLFDNLWILRTNAERIERRHVGRVDANFCLVSESTDDAEEIRREVRTLRLCEVELEVDRASSSSNRSSRRIPIRESPIARAHAFAVRRRRREAAHSASNRANRETQSESDRIRCRRRFERGWGK